MGGETARGAPGMTHQSTKEADTQAGHRHVRGNREITKTGKEKRKGCCAWSEGESWSSLWRA